MDPSVTFPGLQIRVLRCIPVCTPYCTREDPSHPTRRSRSGFVLPAVVSALPGIGGVLQLGGRRSHATLQRWQVSRLAILGIASSQPPGVSSGTSAVLLAGCLSAGAPRCMGYKGLTPVCADVTSLCYHHTLPAFTRHHCPKPNNPPGAASPSLPNSRPQLHLLPFGSGSSSFI